MNFCAKLSLDESQKKLYNEYIKRKEITKMTREEMLNNVVRRFGFEAPETIRFAQYCEDFDNDKVITVAYKWIMMKKIKEE